jgi:hypothetical protein
MTTAGTGAPNGIIRFDTDTFAAKRYLSGTENGQGDYTKVTLGQDGLLYASYPPLHPGNNMLDVIDPSSFRILRTVYLPDSHTPTSFPITYTGFAVDAQGNIYATEGEDWGEGISKFSPQGVWLKYLEVNISYPWLHDLALSPNGELLTLSQDGDVVMTTTDLDSYTSFRNSLLGFNEGFVAWAQAVPEPAALWYVCCSCSGVALMRRCRPFASLCLRRNELNRGETILHRGK